MLASNGKLPADEYFVFWSNLKSPDGSIEHSGDDRTGGNSEGDDETLSVDLTKINHKIHQIVFCVSIYEAEARKQNFGQVRNSFVRIYDQNSGQEIAKYELEEDFSVESAVEFGRLYRRDGKWRFEAMGVGYRGGLQTLLDKYS